MKGLKPDGTPIKVLAVDDSPITRKMIKKALEPEGFAIVAEAGNGKEAIERFLQSKPDIITMDVTMPVLDGLTAATKIKKLNSEQKIIMLSAMGDEDIVADAKTKGIEDFCSKPFKPQEIVEKLIEVFSK